MRTFESDAISFLKLIRRGDSPAGNEKIRLYLSGVIHALKRAGTSQNVTGVPVSEKGGVRVEKDRSRTHRQKSNAKQC